RRRALAERPGQAEPDLLRAKVERRARARPGEPHGRALALRNERDAADDRLERARLAVVRHRVEEEHGALLRTARREADRRAELPVEPHPDVAGRRARVGPADDVRTLRGAAEEICRLARRRHRDPGPGDAGAVLDVLALVGERRDEVE